MPIPQIRVMEHRSHHTHDKKPSRKKLRLWIKRLFLLGLFFFLLGTIYIIGAFAWYSRSLPDPNKILERDVAQSTKIYDRKGETVLYDVHGEEQRTLVKLEQIPDVVKQATLTAEDRDFYNHHGVKFTGMIRAAIVNFFKGYKAQGGSTITQQFVKKAILTSEKTYTRKIKEVVLAYQIEKKFNKDQILQMYLNEIPYGSVAYGVEAASRLYFGKDVKDITLPEATILAAMIKAPSYYSPYGANKAELLSRQQYLIDEMVTLNYITKDQAEAAKKVEVKFQTKNQTILAPHFIFYIKAQLGEKLGDELVESGGLKVISTIDLDKQKAAEEAVKAGVDKRGKQFGFSNASLISLDAKTGQILAMVGSKDYFGKPEPEGCKSGKNCQFEPNDNVTIRLRQPGSSIKPMVYTAAFQKGYTPNTQLYDVKTTFYTDTKNYNPQNYDGAQHGLVTMRQSLAGSLNIPAVKTIYLTGVAKVLDFFELLGYTSVSDRSRFGLSLVLGGAEVSPIEHAAAYGVLANQGVYNAPTGILRVEDNNGNVLLEFEPHERKVIDANLANTTTSILSDNSARAFVFGEKNYLTLGDRPVAAKTGTTNDFHDAWAMGYTPSLVTGVWVGNNDNMAMKKGADGSQIAAPIWNEYMQKALSGSAVEGFVSPSIDVTGKPVLDGTMGNDVTVKIDKYTGKLATDLTPESFIVERRYNAVHDILYYVNKDDPRGDAPADPNVDPAYKSWEAAVQDWYAKQKPASSDVEIAPGVPPTEFDDAHTEANRPTVFIKTPTNFQTITGGNLSAAVNASAPRGVNRVEFYLDEKLLGTRINSPYDFVYPLNSYFVKGQHKFRAIAFDDIDNSNEASVTVNIDVNVSTPSVNWIIPSSGAAFSKSNMPIPMKVWLTDLASTKNISFFAQKVGSNDVKSIASIILPQSQDVSFEWNDREASGTYEITAEITDPYGNKLRAGAVTITIN